MFQPSQFSDDGYGYSSGADGRAYAAQTMFDTYSPGSSFGGVFDELLKAGADFAKKAGQDAASKIASGEMELKGDGKGIAQTIGNIFQIGKKKKEEAAAAAKKKRMLKSQKRAQEAKAAEMAQARLEAERAAQVKLVIGGSTLALIGGLVFTKFVFPKW